MGASNAIIGCSLIVLQLDIDNQLWQKYPDIFCHSNVEHNLLQNIVFPCIPCTTHFPISQTYSIGCRILSFAHNCQGSIP